MSSDQRKSKRAPYALLAALRTDAVELTLPAKDLSVGGVRLIYTGDRLAAGQQVELDFELPDSDRTIEVRGRIAHITGEDVGIEFGPLKVPVRKALERYVAETRY